MSTSPPPMSHHSDVKVERQAIERLLGDLFALNPHIAKEFSYEKKLARVTIRVMSSIPWRENYKEQFIRVCLIHGVSEKMLTYFRIPLDEHWQLRLRFMLMRAHEEAKLVKLCECGGLLHMKHGSRGDFFACTKCRYKENV